MEGMLGCLEVCDLLPRLSSDLDAGTLHLTLTVRSAKYITNVAVCYKAGLCVTKLGVCAWKRFATSSSIYVRQRTLRNAASDSRAKAAALATMPPMEWPTRMVGTTGDLPSVYCCLSHLMQATAYLVCLSCMHIGTVSPIVVAVIRHCNRADPAHCTLPLHVVAR